MCEYKVVNAGMESVERQLLAAGWSLDLRCTCQVDLLHDASPQPSSVITNISTKASDIPEWYGYRNV